jgi:hypothetical protein
MWLDSWFAISSSCIALKSSETSGLCDGRCRSKVARRGGTVGIGLPQACTSGLGVSVAEPQPTSLGPEPTTAACWAERLRCRHRVFPLFHGAPNRRDCQATVCRCWCGDCAGKPVQAPQGNNAGPRPPARVGESSKSSSAAITFGYRRRFMIGEFAIGK